MAAALFCATAGAADWPNFRGPNHNGISSETGWLVKWPAEGPKLLWKASVGLGYAAITVANGRAYAAGNTGDNATLYCFDAETGSNVWKFSCANQILNDFSKPKGMGGTSGSPTIEGDRVYLMSGDGCLFALEAQSGAVVWSNNFVAELGLTKPHWGFTGSPLVQDNLLVLDVGGSGTAVDKTTGKVVWTSDKATSGYSTPVPCSFNGVPAVAILSVDTRLRGGDKNRQTDLEFSLQDAEQPQHRRRDCFQQRLFSVRRLQPRRGHGPLGRDERHASLGERGFRQPHQFVGSC